MIDLEDLLPFVRQIIPTVSEPVAVDALRQSAHEWCKKVKCWRQTEAITFTIDPDMRIAPAGVTLVAIDWVRDATRRKTLTPLSYSDFHDDTGIRSKYAGTHPDVFTQDTYGYMQIFPFADRTVDSDPLTLDVSMYLTPMLVPDVSQANFDDMNRIPRNVSELFGRNIADGAVSRIYEYAGPMQNPQAAMMYLAKFNAARVEHESFHVTGQQRAPMRTRSQFM